MSIYTSDYLKQYGVTDPTALAAVDALGQNKTGGGSGKRLKGVDYSGGGGGGGNTQTIVIGGSAPDYSSNIGATLGAARMGAPTLVSGYKDAWDNLAKDKDAADQLYNDNINQAYDTYNQNMRQQNMQIDDYWYQHQQKINNWRRLTGTQVGPGMFGSLAKEIEGLNNVENDIFNQNLYATLRAGKQSAKQSLMDNVNPLINNKRQNDLDFESQRRNLELQYKNAAAEYVTNIFNQLGNYGASKYIDKNGNVTGAGLAFVNELNQAGLGVQSDGKGSWTVDTSAIFADNPAADEIFGRLTSEKNMPFLPANFDGYRRTLDETNKTMQDRSDTIDKTRSRKTLTAPEYWAKYNNRYG